MAADYVFKVIIVGEAGVGKSCLLRRYADQSFTENYINTIGVDFKVRTLDVNGRTVKLNIWDSAGQERFRTIVNTYYRGAHGICVVYDITDTESFEKVGDWLHDVGELAEPSAKKLIIGSKLDLEGKRTVPLETVEKYAESLGIQHIETSSKNGQNVNHVFSEMTKMLLLDVAGDDVLEHDDDIVQIGGNTSGVGEPPPPKKKGCC
jgi:Ras-related protein Rab-1A